MNTIHKFIDISHILKTHINKKHEPQAPSTGAFRVPPRPHLVVKGGRCSSTHRSHGSISTRARPTDASSPGVAPTWPTVAHVSSSRAAPPPHPCHREKREEDERRTSVGMEKKNRHAVTTPLPLGKYRTIA
jgi:hypothetical protein